MTDRLDEILARLDAATTGPWELFRNQVVAKDDDGARREICNLNGRYFDRVANAAFIMHAPEDMEYLHERVRKWRQLAEDAIAQFDDARRLVSDHFPEQFEFTDTSREFALRRAALTEGVEVPEGDGE